MIAYLWVFIGGGLGSMCRFGISQIFSSSNSAFPWGTFVANAISCIVLGYLLGIMLKEPLSPMWKLLLATGFCGGFSTFSTFSGDTLLLFQSGQHTYAMLNIAGSILMGLLCIFIGLKLAG
jgi:CrcB protein